MTIGTNKCNYDPMISESISIGFGTKQSPFESHVGWFNSVGIHINDGKVRNNSIHTSTKISEKCIPGDNIGSGLIFINPNLGKVFFTVNGKLVYTSEPFILYTPYFPMIGYDYSHSIKLNFSNKKFMFDIKKIIFEYSSNIISTENLFIEDYNDTPFKNSISKLKPRPIVTTFTLPSLSDLPTTLNENIILNENLVSNSIMTSESINNSIFVFTNPFIN
jgi:hypothetical protein